MTTPREDAFNAESSRQWPSGSAIIDCPSCQFKNRVGARFCSACGVSLQMACPVCATMSQSGARFCDHCGASLGMDTKANTIDFSQPLSYTPKFLVEKILTTKE